MYLGSVASSVRQVLAHWARGVRLPVLLAGAGNFTMAAALRAGGYTGKIHACDVSLYTSVVGAYLSGRPLALDLAPETPRQIQGLVRLDSPLEKDGD